MSRLVDADAIKLPKGFFEKVDNVPKFYEWLNTIPTIDPVKHGRWTKAERQGCWSYADVYKQCSECGKVTFLAEKMNYCPNCGADMRGESNDRA